MRRNSLLVVCLILFFSCTDENVKFKDIEGQTWSYENLISFTLTKEEFNSGSPQLHIRHTEAYPFQNIWLKLSIEPVGEELNFTRKEFQIAHPDGKWIGKKKGALYTLSVPIEEEPRCDSCSFIIQHNMRQNPLPGIQAVGISIE